MKLAIKKLIDGEYYYVVFNNGQDSVNAMWIKKWNLFSHMMGSLSYDEVEEIKHG